MDLLLSIIAGALAGAGVVMVVLTLGRGRAIASMAAGGVAAVVGVALLVAASPDETAEYVAVAGTGLVAGATVVLVTLLRGATKVGDAARAVAGRPSAVERTLDAQEPLTLEQLRALGRNPADFGEVVAEGFRRMGYRVAPAERGAAADLVLTKEGRTALVQATKWAREAPDLASVQAFVRSALASRCFEAYVLSPHEVSGDVMAWSHDPGGLKGLRGGLFLVTGEDLPGFLEPVRTAEG